MEATTPVWHRALGHFHTGVFYKPKQVIQRKQRESIMERFKPLFFGLQILTQNGLSLWVLKLLFYTVDTPKRVCGNSDVVT